MIRPSAGELVAFGIATAVGCQAFRHRHLIAALVWGRRLSRRACIRCGHRRRYPYAEMCLPCLWGPLPERPDPTASDPTATARYLATHRSNP